MLVLEAFMVGVFAATDVFLFYVFFEAMLIPVYFLIGLFGGARRQYAAVKFLLFSLAGGLVMLVAVIAVYVAGPGGDEGFLITNLTGNLDASTDALRWMFVGFFIAFAVKAPMWPVHTWLPDAATEARPATAVLLVGILDKVGTYGMIRFCLQLFPEAAQWATPVVITLAVISIIYGALLAIGQTDMMRLIAFTSISHFGLIVLGIFALTTVGGAGSTLYMVNHGFSTAGLFLLAGFLVARRGSKRIPDYGGWQRVTPVLAGTFLVVGLSSLALPGLSSFVSEFLVLQGTFMRYEAAAVIATLGTVLAALYILLMYQRTMTGPKPSFAEGEGPARPVLAREGRRRTHHRLVHRARVLPEAGARPAQPGRRPDAALRRRHRPQPDERLRERQVTAAVTAATEFQGRRRRLRRDRPDARHRGGLARGGSRRGVRAPPVPARHPGVVHVVGARRCLRGPAGLVAPLDDRHPGWLGRRRRRLGLPDGRPAAARRDQRADHGRDLRWHRR
jgi:proton-translocating NADH-quinone oxidoreductase chain M